MKVPLWVSFEFHLWKFSSILFRLKKQVFGALCLCHLAKHENYCDGSINADISIPTYTHLLMRQWKMRHLCFG